MKRLWVLLFLIVSTICTDNISGASVTLSWTAPGDDGNVGTAAQYEIRFSTEPLTAESWDKAGVIKNVPRPKPAGTRQFCMIAGLEADITYYFAIKAADERPNWSDLSNIAVKIAHDDECTGTTGNVDCDPDDLVDMGDLTVLIDHLYISLRPLCSPSEANVDGIYGVDMGDLTLLIDHLFIGLTPLPDCPELVL